MKKVSEILQELKTNQYIIEVVSYEGGTIGRIRTMSVLKEAIGSLLIRPNEYYLNKKNVAVMTLHEQDNIAHLQIIYKVIADWKQKTLEAGAK